MPVQDISLLNSTSFPEPQLTYKYTAASPVVNIFWNNVIVGASNVKEKTIHNPFKYTKLPSTIMQGPNSDVVPYADKSQLKSAVDLAKIYNQIKNCANSNNVKIEILDLAAKMGYNIQLLSNPNNSPNLIKTEINELLKNLEVLSALQLRSTQLKNCSQITPDQYNEILIILKHEKQKIIALLRLQNNPITQSDSQFLLASRLDSNIVFKSSEDTLFKPEWTNKAYNDRLTELCDFFDKSPHFTLEEKNEIKEKFRSPDADLDKLGCIDVARVGTLKDGYSDQACYGFVADGTGHGKPTKHPLHNKIFDEYLKNLQNDWSQLLPTNLEEIQILLQNSIARLSQDAEQKTCASTMSMALIVKSDNQKTFLITVHLGDSALYLVSKKNRTVEKLTTTDGCELGAQRAGVLSVRQIQKDDICIGITDGISDFLTEKDLKETFLENENPAKLLQELKYKILNSNPRYNHADSNSTVKEFDATRDTNSDDISCFALQT